MIESGSSDIRILRVHNRFVVGGPLTHVAELTLKMPQPYTTMLVGGGADMFEQDALPYLALKGIQARIIPSLQRKPSLWRDLQSFITLRRMIREYRPHVVHSHGAKSGFLARIAARLEHVPVVVHTYHGHTFHSYFSPLKQRLYLVLERWANRKVNAVIALSSSQRRELGEEYSVCPLSKIHVIPLGFDIREFTDDWVGNRSSFRSRYGIAGETIVIGWVGRMVAIKDPFLFIDVIRILAGRGLQFKAVMIGDGPLRGIAEGKIKAELDADAADRIVFTSWIHPPQKAIAGLDILLLTSFNEGTPLSILEAGAGGVPVVSVDVGGVSETMLPGKSGFLCPDRDPEAMADLVTKIMADPELRRSMAESGLSFVRTGFDSTRLIADISTLYARLLHEKGIEVHSL